MEQKQHRERRANRVVQRIGPALRELRRREALTLEELARHCGLSVDVISAIENGRREVTLTSLMRLSEALGVDVTYFTSYHSAVTQTEAELREILNDIDFGPENVPAFLTLSFEAQGALLDGLRWLTMAHSSRPLRATEIVDRVLSHGVQASIAHILSGIAKIGLDDTGFCHAITQMEELDGDRLVMSDRLLSVTDPNSGYIDPVDVFRSIFRRDPDDPKLVRLWAQSLQSAVRQNVEQFATRTIYPLSAIRTYIESGYWGRGVEVDAGLMRRHVAGLVQTMRANPNMLVGLLDEDVPFNLLIKGHKQAMAYIRRGNDVFPGQGHGVAFRTVRTDVVRKFREYFEDVWDAIPVERRDRESVSAWLEHQLATTAT